MLKSKKPNVLPRLVIQTDSWHYNYYLCIRRFWGLTDAPEKTSLCPYCQTILWFTIFAVIASPLFLLGWIFLKLHRIVYKLVESRGFDMLVDFIDESPLGQWMDFIHKDNTYKSSFGKMTFFSSIIYSFFIIVFLGCLCSLYLLFISLAQLPYVLSVIWDYSLWGLAYLGYGCLHIFGLLGLFLVYIGYVINSLIQILLSVQFWQWVSAIVIIVGSFVFLGFGLFYIGILLSRNEAVHNFWEKYIIMKLNGFGEARERASKRREAEIRARIEAEINYIKPSNPSKFTRFFKFLKDSLLSSKQEVGNATTKILGPIEIAWIFIVSLKKRACPIVEFLTPEQIELVKSISNSCQGNDKLNLYDEKEIQFAWEWLTFRTEFDLERYDNGERRTKQKIIEQFFEKERCPRMRVFLGQYILDQITYKMLVERLETDLEVLKQLQEQKESEKPQSESQE